MANLGALAEFMNSKEFYLQVGSDQYIGITDLIVHLEKSESRTTPIDVGPMYRYGLGNNFMSGTMKATGPEWIDFNTKNQIDSEGEMNGGTVITWLVKGTQLDGTIITLTAAGILRTLEIRKAERKVMMDFNIRITGDEVTVA